MSGENTNAVNPLFSRQTKATMLTGLWNLCKVATQGCPYDFTPVGAIQDLTPDFVNYGRPSQKIAIQRRRRSTCKSLTGSNHA